MTYVGFLILRGAGCFPFIFHRGQAREVGDLVAESSRVRRMAWVWIARVILRCAAPRAECA